jgi:hypothetical protein
LTKRGFSVNVDGEKPSCFERQEDFKLGQDRATWQRDDRRRPYHGEARMHWWMLAIEDCLNDWATLKHDRPKHHDAFAERGIADAGNGIDG